MHRCVLIMSMTMSCRTLSETAALQLMSLEAHAKPVQRPADDKSSSVWFVLNEWAKEAHGAGKLPQLLRIYVEVVPRGVAALELFSDVLSGAAPFSPIKTA